MVIGMDRDKLKGVFAPVVTPFEDDKIKFDWLEENLERLNETKLAGYLALGTNGEFKSLTESEKIQIVKLFVKLKGDKVLMVGTGCESTYETIEFTNRIADLGADFASVITPHYFASQMKDETLIAYYQEVAEHSSIPVLLYNIPKLTSNVSISSGAIKVLSLHPNIWGIKDSGGVSIFSFLSVVSDDFCVMAGSANYFLPSLMVGAVGGVISLANCFPQDCCELYTASLSEDFDKARKLHQRILQANSVVSGKHEVAGVKMAMNLAGYRGGIPRRPLQPLAEEQRQIMQRKLRELGFLK
jgi:4-hydroxy-2-oxoglutarate aldolase